MKNILILGYGNPDRQDDGVAWHVIRSLAAEMGVSDIQSDTEAQVIHTKTADLLFQLQLTPEVAETIAGYQGVCFVDAHTGAVKNELNLIEVSPSYQASPFTHHMTPQTCLSIAQNLFHHTPENSILVSIRGYSFGFSRDLSEKTQALAQDAVKEILTWVQQHNT